MRPLLFYVVAYVFLVVQTSAIISKLSFSDTRPDLLLILVVLHSLEFNRIPSLFFAFVTGLMLDLFNPEWFGLNAFGFTICAYVVSCASSRIYRERLLNRLIFIFFIYCIRDSIVFILTGKIIWSSVFPRYFSSTIPGAIWTTFFAVFLIPIIDFVSGRISGSGLQVPDEE